MERARVGTRRHMGESGRTRSGTYSGLLRADCRGHLRAALRNSRAFGGEVQDVLGGGSSFSFYRTISSSAPPAGFARGAGAAAAGGCATKSASSRARLPWLLE